ncbi:MAG: DDE-type integrase/transposase/recombinase, partial [Saprospiraceae bacterium]
WGVSNSLDAAASLDVVKDAVQVYGIPEILNSDQGSQFTCSGYVNFLKKQGIQISMDGKGRALDNIYINDFGGPLNISIFTLTLQTMASNCTGE